jgi:DNA-binding MarR family transcriptional regulator
MAVAAHDRFNKNGKGCCASHPRLARLAKCHLKSLSRSLKALAERGYIEGLPSPFNKRQRAYRVVYGDADRAIITNPIGNNPATYQDADDGVIGNNAATETDPIGNKEFYEPEQNQGFPVHKRFSETGNRFSETVEESLAQAKDAGERKKGFPKYAREAVIDDEEADDAFEERAAIIHEAHTRTFADDGTPLTEPNFEISWEQAEKNGRARATHFHHPTGAQPGAAT